MPHQRLLGAALIFIAMLTGLSLWLVSCSAPEGAIERLRSVGSVRVAVDQVLPTFLGSTDHVNRVRAFGFSGDERPPDRP